MVLSIQAKEEDDVTVRMRAMTCGYLHANAAPFMEGLKGRIALPIPSYLIEHPKGRVLFDTGLHPQLRESPEDRLGEYYSYSSYWWGHRTKSPRDW